MSRRPISARRARLIRAGIDAAIADWQTGQRSTLHAIHPTTVAAYGRTLARLRMDQLVAEHAAYWTARAALIQHIVDQHATQADRTEFAKIMRENGFQ